MKLVVPKVNAFSDENSFDTGKELTIDHCYATDISFSFFPELNMYVNTLPDMQRLLSQNGERIELAPR